MSTTFRITTVALAAALCWQAPAHAAATATATEAQLRSVTLYADVSIQQDSTSSWGPWAEFEAPAAGNTQPVAAPRATNEPYRPLPQTGTVTDAPPELPPIVEGFCAGGSICGFVVVPEGDPNTGAGEPDLNPFRLNGTVVTGAEGEGALLPQAVQLPATALSSSGTPPEYGTLELTLSEGNFSYTRKNSRGRTVVELTPDYTQPGYDEQTSEANQAVNFKLVDYARGTQSWGVIGYTTATADMAALRASSAQATYSGSDHNGTPVQMTVNFGNATWSGSLNGGADSAVSAKASSSGGTVLTGRVGADITGGTITGSTFSATAANITARDGTIQAGSMIQGAFFGPNAAAAGGVVDIRKTTQSYNNGRYVAPFIATKNGTAN